MPSRSDLILIFSLLLTGIGIAFEFSWPIACIVIGIIVMLLILKAKMNE